MCPNTKTEGALPVKIKVRGVKMETDIADC